MRIFIFLILLIMAIYGPQFWAKRILTKYSRLQEHYPGTGAELARHLLDRLDMPHVSVEIIEGGDHYDPMEKAVRLNRTNCEKKSLTAVVVATHEVGHAIQDNIGYGPLHARTRLVRFAQTAEKVGAGLMMAIPLIAVVTRVPAMGVLTFLGGLAILGTPVVVHLLTLPVEWDASFRRALPILKANLSEEEQSAAREILTACALTYLAASLASLLNLWRWIRILRR
ncbi:zinc metallopeptidase [Desulfonema magnum]|uniref:Zinc metallopeptidase n=1 Tax=Desulfonema magnum TaxID=45655 RepID=A0A975BQ71_9BACT|nr:zinc metallopeptidase [Desulfonema magnum]QTA89540.1 Zinc metallopeptidase [Desulfonema magnum]